MNTLPANQTLTYATVQTDANGAITSISNGTGEFPMNIVFTGMQGQYIQWPNGTKQQTAMNDLVANQTYTNATITTDAYGVIKTLATGTIPTPTIPVKVASAYGTYSSSFTSFTISTNGGTSGAWAQNQFLLLDIPFLLITMLVAQHHFNFKTMVLQLVQWIFIHIALVLIGVPTQTHQH